MEGYFGRVFCVQGRARFYRHVIDKLLAELIQQEFPLTPADNQDKNRCEMTSEERMALRYIAGYVCRKVRKDIEDSSDPQKEDMTFLYLQSQWGFIRRLGRIRSLGKCY